MFPGYLVRFMTRWLRLRLWLGRNLLALLGSLFALALAFLFLSPLLFWFVDSFEIVSPRMQRTWFDLLETVNWWSIQAIICAWVFALGSSIASFLNVVAYRLPRGRSILGRSSCPRCNQRLSLWENMPIFGWLRYGGRCRTCRLPISPRYLWVELILGTVFLTIFFLDVGTIQAIRAMQDNGSPATSLAFHNLRAFALHAALASLVFLGFLFFIERSSGDNVEPSPIEDDYRREAGALESPLEQTVRADTDQATLRSDVD